MSAAIRIVPFARCFLRTVAPGQPRRSDRGHSIEPLKRKNRKGSRSRRGEPAENPLSRLGIIRKYAHKILSHVGVKKNLTQRTQRDAEERNENGQALINIISQNPGAVTIKAIVNGIGIQNAEAFGNADVVVPEVSIVNLEHEDSGLLGLVGGFNMIFLIIPVAIAAIFLFLKRTNRLEEINFGEKFEEIKERVAGIRER